MAIFNPAVEPTKPRDYRESRDVVPGQPIYAKGQAPNTIQPTGITRPDISQGLAYQGAAHAIEGAGKLGALTAGMADTVVKNELSEQLFTKLNNEREAYTAALRTVNTAVGARGGGGSASLDEVAQASGEEAGGTTPDVMAEREHANPTTDEPPAEVAAVPQKLGQLVAARGAGKISPTEYLGRQNAILKDVRYNWSGWREYIDREASSILGGNVANMYVRSLMHDFNAAAAGKAQKDPNYTRDMNFATANIGLLHGTTIYQDVRNQVPGATERLYAHVAPYAAAEESVKIANNKRTLAVEGEKATQFLAEAEGEKVMNSVTMRNFNTFIPGGDAPTAQATTDYVIKVQTGQLPKPTTEQARALYDNFAGLKAKARAELLEYGTKEDKNGRSLVKDFGGMGKYIAKVEDQLKIYDVAMDGLQNENYGLIKNAANAVAAANDDEALRLSNHSVGKWLRTGAIIAKMGGPQGLFNRLYNQEALGDSAEAPMALHTYVQGIKGDAVTQPDLSNKGILKTITGAVDDAQKKKDLIADMPRTIQSFVKIAEKIAHKDYPDEAKSNLVMWTFSPGENRALLTKFEREGNVDPVTGLTTREGKFSIFERLTKTDIGTEVARLDKLYPEKGLMTMYKDTTESWFGRELISKEVNNITQLGSTMFKDASIKYYDSKEPGGPRLEVKFDPRNTNPYAQAQATQAITNINRSLTAMARVGSVTGRNTDEYLFSVLTALGYNAKGPITGFPEKLIKSIIGSTDEALKEQERIRAKYRTEAPAPAAPPSLTLTPRTRMNPSILGTGE